MSYIYIQIIDLYVVIVLLVYIVRTLVFSAA